MEVSRERIFDYLLSTVLADVGVYTQNGQQQCGK